jgi:hypothetical protein
MAVDLQAPRVRQVKEWQFDVAHGITTVDADAVGGGSPMTTPVVLKNLIAEAAAYGVSDTAKGPQNKFRVFAVQQLADVLFAIIPSGTGGTFLIAASNLSGAPVDLTGGTVKIIVQEYRSNRSR